MKKEANQTQNNANNAIEHQPMKLFVEKAYLDYSMYVILDRALPHIEDGLKPVQRRIIYAMSELGLKNTAKFKKSARTVGDVLGKYHPHSDVACYEAMVLMAQNFSYRYPLIDGQGNWGSMDDPKSFAAMRYTESRLTPYAEILLKELEDGIVEWAANFDGTLTEPKLLPARLPNVLLNGASGIAVGMATDIPPHNLREVATACIHLLDNPKTAIEELCTYIPAPDFPTAAEIITPPNEIIQIYKNGNGGIKARAVYQENGDEIIITALPYQVSGAKIQEQIAEQMQAKKLPMVIDVRDESDHENPTRIVISLRSNRVDTQSLMSHLFATTLLENNYRINLNIIGINGKPRVKNLLELLNEWLSYRTDTVKKRLQLRIDKISSRLHLLQGFMAAYLNIDEVIKIIREEDEPKNALIKKFKLSTQQVDAILDIKLRSLAKLEEIKIRTEQELLTTESKELIQITESPKLLKNLIKKELKEDAEKYGDKRKSKLVARQEAKAIAYQEIIPVEPVTVILSSQGWARVAKGHEINPETLSYKTGDSFKQAVYGRNNQLVVFIDSNGKSYCLQALKLPSARSQGEPLTSHFTTLPGATFEGMLMGEPEQLVLLASDAGYGFIAKLEDLFCKNRGGKAIINLPKNSKALPPQLITDINEQYLAIITNELKMLVLPVNCLPTLAKGKGNKIIGIPSSKASGHQEYVTNLIVFNKTNKLALGSNKRSITLNFDDLMQYKGERGRRGNKLPKGLQAITSLAVSNN